ncbi:rRNA maturation RNase YbeY [Coraliomargarita akajimensis]|uniref:Endoribonuclease YbeY n=1 Tax=Coraliomargarita akajimensis (strain DSM 45221 / IAM 15411 / JCM 23193 / KCTC 12865 / 04OKA010-24) TaxID=583355 RepID=D5EHW3_CORAD|nr:rRNA maturation RNase YbeY [Coraliomargarita akajimensis]ADE54154.1 protein of unknown function UPF0054 [Coraliomargarita akajimensis DSM 45221]
MSQIQLEINNRYKQLLDPESATVTLFTAIEASGHFPIQSGELSIVFVGDPEIGQIHDDFMDDPSPTDVITFPADPEMDFAGEIIVSVDHAIRKSKELDLPLTRELSLYLVHGWLHLAGYDDLNEADRAEMRKAEQIALDLIDAHGAPVDFKLA